MCPILDNIYVFISDSVLNFIYKIDEMLLLSVYSTHNTFFQNSNVLCVSLVSLNVLLVCNIIRSFLLVLQYLLFI